MTTVDESDDMNAKTDRERAPKWKHDGVRVIPGHALDPNTPQTPGMDRKAAVNYARVGAQKIWAGTVNIRPNAKTGAHHHGELESIIYEVRGLPPAGGGVGASGGSPALNPVGAITSMCRVRTAPGAHRQHERAARMRSGAER